MSGVVYCGCGHAADEHPSGGGCVHMNAGRKFPAPARCACAALAPDPRLTDSDGFVGKVLQKVCSKHGIATEHVEWEDAAQVLAIALWKTARKYDSRSHVRFRVYAYLELTNDAIDHFRAERGRNGQHRLPDSRAYDAADFDVDDLDGAARVDRLDGTASRDPADDPDGWAADGGGLLTSRDGPEAGMAGEPRQHGRHRDQVGDPRPVRPDDRRPRPETQGARGEPESLRGAA